MICPYCGSNNTEMDDTPNERKDYISYNMICNDCLCSFIYVDDEKDYIWYRKIYSTDYYE